MGIFVSSNCYHYLIFLIVMTSLIIDFDRTILEFSSPSTVITSGAAAFFQAVWRFCLMFFASAAIGVAFGLVSAMVSTLYFNTHI